MFSVRPFEVTDILPLLKEEINSHLSAWAESGHAETLKRETMAFTGLFNGEIVGCFGVAEIWKGRGYLWTVFSEKIKEHPVAIHRGFKNFFQTLPFNRIEMDCPYGLEIAARRARWMGFEVMCAKAERYLANDGDATTYHWVRKA